MAKQKDDFTTRQLVEIIKFLATITLQLSLCVLLAPIPIVSSFLTRSVKSNKSCK